MKKILAKMKWGLYCNLSRKIESYIPEKYHPYVQVVPTTKTDATNGRLDIVSIELHIPHDLTKKLMWYLKVWRKSDES